MQQCRRQVHGRVATVMLANTVLPVTGAHGSHVYQTIWHMFLCVLHDVVLADQS